MDKVELTVADINALLNWRDEHKELVRSLPAPLKAVEICFKHNGLRIKGIREGDTLQLHLSTYILRQDNGVLVAAPKGSHASPKGTFTVRGHYRHYASGKVVWIAEYKKGTGKKKAKTYKIGRMEDDKSED